MQFISKGGEVTGAQIANLTSIYLHRFKPYHRIPQFQSLGVSVLSSTRVEHQFYTSITARECSLQKRDDQTSVLPVIILVIQRHDQALNIFFFWKHGRSSSHFFIMQRNQSNPTWQNDICINLTWESDSCESLTLQGDSCQSPALQNGSPTLSMHQDCTRQEQQ